ncbi:helix-turn-helix domain-containing protein [Streptomyces sp. NPDC046977]|uniref:helix-turn-helix domain-containing protein n=1 Tax=Streptomyces sp. NPDC046977 TaxID=3154703 RepID=UPI0033ED2B5C
MPHRFDLRSFAPGDRADAIREQSRSLNGHIEVDLPPDPAQLRAVAVTTALRSVEVADISWNLTGLRRSTGPLTDDVEPQVFLAIQESGVSRVSQGSREAELRPGGLVLLETAKSYSISFHGSIRTAAVRIPTRTLGLPSPLLDRVTAVPLRPDLPVVDAVTAFFSRLIRGQEALGADEADLLAQPSVELVRALVTTGLGREDLAREPLHLTLPQRVLAYARLHLAEHDLSAARIAAAHHVSVRHLYLTLSRAGISLGEWIKTERLEECKRELATPASRYVTIDAISHRWGFGTAAHFSRAFRAAYGMSPSEWRRTADGLPDPR